jgi:hypothetical protein
MSLGSPIDFRHWQPEYHCASNLKSHLWVDAQVDSKLQVSNNNKINQSCFQTTFYNILLTWLGILQNNPHSF